METTLNIDETIFKALEHEAERRGLSVSVLVEEAVRGMLDRPAGQAKGEELPPPLSYNMGKFTVDVADTDQFYNLTGSAYTP